MTSSNKTKGFTLVELLIVIVVIAILAAISIVAYNGVTQKARDDERQTNARNLLNAAASYQADKDEWPTVENLKDYSVIRLDAELTKPTVTAEDKTPGSGSKNVYKYEICKTGSPAANTGVRVTYYKEADNSTPSITTGKCS